MEQTTRTQQNIRKIPTEAEIRAWLPDTTRMKKEAFVLPLAEKDEARSKTKASLPEKKRKAQEQQKKKKRRRAYRRRIRRGKNHLREDAKKASLLGISYGQYQWQKLQMQWKKECA